MLQQKLMHRLIQLTINSVYLMNEINKQETGHVLVFICEEGGRKFKSYLLEGGQKCMEMYKGVGKQKITDVEHKYFLDGP